MPKPVRLVVLPLRPCRSPWWWRLTWSSTPGRSHSRPSPKLMVELASLELIRLMAASLRTEAALAGDGRLGLRLAQFHASREGSPAEEAALLLARGSASAWKLSTRSRRGCRPGCRRRPRRRGTLPLLCSLRSEDQRRAQRRARSPWPCRRAALAHAVAVPHAAGPLALVGTFEEAQEGTAWVGAADRPMGAWVRTGRALRRPGNSRPNPASHCLVNSRPCFGNSLCESPPWSVVSRPFL